jgi:hypothetical protein
MVFKTWDLNFGAWIFTLTVSKIKTWKLLGHDFQDVGSSFWDLNFTQGLHSGLRSRAPTSYSNESNHNIIQDSMMNSANESLHNLIY